MSSDLHESEPGEYAVLKSSAFNRATIGDRMIDIGFCVNSPGAAGYSDEGAILIADQITDPARVIEIAVHECLHLIFPKLTEAEVLQHGKQIGDVVVGVFLAKKAKLPELKPLLTKKNAGKLFPGAVMRDGISSSFAEIPDRKLAELRSNFDAQEWNDTADGDRQ